MVRPNSDTSKDKFHRIGMKAITVDTESMAPNSSTDPVPIVGEFWDEPTPVVKTSISCWMRWSGLSVWALVNRPR